MPRRIPYYPDLLRSWILYILCNHTRVCIFESVSIPRCNPSSRTFKFDVSSLVGNCLSGVEAYPEVPLASRREENSEIRATSERETRFLICIFHPRSGILDTISDMKEKAESTLSDARAAEMKAGHESSPLHGLEVQVIVFLKT